MDGPLLRPRNRDHRELLGRDADRERVETAITTNPGRLVTITGRGGVGKTLLAASVAARAPSETNRRPIVVRLEALTDPSQVVDSIVRTLGLTGVPASPLDAIAEHLRGTASLLVLDNFEHVLRAAPQIAELLDRTDDLVVLVTSQAPLHLERERLVTIHPLAVPAAGADLESLRSSPAVEMYRAQVAVVDASFRIDDSNAEAVGELVRQLEGLPLAIELAAARATILPAQAVLRRDLSARLDVLASSSADAPPRQSDLRAAVAWTLDLLTPTEQVLFARLSVISGPFTLEAAEALSVDPGRVIDEMSTLVDVHLVEPVVGVAGALFALPSAVRVVAGERLAAARQTAAAAAAHIRASATWCRQTEDGAIHGKPISLFEIVDRYDDLVSCLQDALAAGAIPDALDVLNGLISLWDAQGYNAAREELALRVLAEATARGTRTRAHAIVRSWVPLLALQHQLRTDLDQQLAMVAEAEALARSMNDDVALLHVLACQVLVAPYAGFPSSSVLAATEGLRLAEALGSMHFVSSFEIWLGMLDHMTGQEERAVELGARALSRAQESGDHRNVLLAALLLRPLQASFPELEAIVPTSREALDIARRNGETVFEALLLQRATGEALDEGDLESAQQCALACLIHARTAPPVFACYSLVVALQLHAKWDEGERVAWLAGVLESSRSVIEATFPPRNLRRLDRTLERVRAELGADAFEQVAARGRLLSLSAATRACETFIRERVAPQTAPEPPPPPLADGASLTPRQTEVLRLLTSGLTNREIAARLGLTPKTVMHHLAAVYLAIHARGRTEAIAWAFRHGISG